MPVKHHKTEARMSKTTVIEYEDSDGMGTVTLCANPFKDGKFYAKFDRTTVNIDNLIARIQKKEVGTNAIMAKQMASLFKAEILEAFSRGEAVNLFDLGTLYIKATGELNGKSPETARISNFQVKFTASKVTNDAVSSLGIKKIVMSNTSPIISSLTDLYSGEKTDSFTPGKSIRIEGSRLKIAGEEGGIFFAPVTEKGEPDTDETKWTKVSKVIRNVSKTLEFFLPEELAKETPYCIAVKTNSSGSSASKKSYSITFSDVVTVKAA